MSKNFTPFIASNKKVAEFSFRAVFLGLFLGLLFAIANAYLGLKVGMTVSASIPAAVISMGLLNTFCKKVSILEHNIVQTISTVGEGLAAGVIFTVPALMFLGESPSIFRIFLLSSLGGVIGILFMIPMRRYLIVKEHGILPFPEGTACAEILKAKEHASGMMAAWGFLAGAIYKVCSNILNIFPEVASWVVKPFQNAAISIDATPSLLGVGYIIGPRISGFLFAGGILGWWVIIPIIHMFGGDVIIHPATTAISTLSSDEIWSNYVRYIGAGAVAIGGLFSLVKITPMLVHTIKVGFKELFSGFNDRGHLPRVEKDISMAYLILGSLATILILWLFPGMPMNFFTILLLTILAFFFAAVTSLTVGLVGSSSNPVSGMVITVLLLTCILFVMLGWTERIYLISAITMSCVASVAICMSATTSQDLKTGFLLGATPFSQQVAELLGIILPSLALGGTLYLLNQAYELGSIDMPAPQAALMAMIAKGVIAKSLPYNLVIIGILIGCIMQILNIPVLAFAIGLYLPLSLSTAMMAGGLVAAYVNRHSLKEVVNDQARLVSAGLIGGDACVGIAIALLTVLGVLSPSSKALLSPYVSLAAFVGLGLFVIAISTRKAKRVS